MSVLQPTTQTPDSAVIRADRFNFYYGSFKALDQVSMTGYRNKVTALIGPSGCGKSTFLRAINRMHDLTPGARCDGELIFNGQNIPQLNDVATLRKKIGMIFQRPNPFPMSIFDNVAYGMRLETQRYAHSEISDRVVAALKAASLWGEVKDKLKEPGLALSGGQQQRLCIARAIAVEPDVLLMDEPCSALDPIATGRIEDLIRKLAETYTILIVTHNMQQAGRVSDYTAFFSVNEKRAGQLVEYGLTTTIFTHPKEARTNDYINGRFG
ncbi:MAG: phosphate ABC transporter ATP-binding protein PstB [Caldilineaceae bacterium]